MSEEPLSSSDSVGKSVTLGMDFSVRFERLHVSFSRGNKSISLTDGLAVGSLLRSFIRRDLIS